MKITKRLSIFITIFVLILGTQFIKPKKAEAFLGIADVDVGSMMTALKEYGIDTLVTILNNRILDKLINDTVNWAKGGFDGDPGFINNWDGFLEGVKHDALSNALRMATNEAYKKQGDRNKVSEKEKASCITDAKSKYQDNLLKVEISKTYWSWMKEMYSADTCEDSEKNCINDEINNEGSSEEEAQDICAITYNDCNVKSSLKLIELEIDKPMTAKQASDILNQEVQNCENGISDSGIWGDAGDIAADNWNMYRNTGVINARSVASTVVKYGAKKLNENTLNSLIKGEGNTIKYLLGSQENVDNFKNDFKYGGWVGYMALADPHNTPDGVNSMVKNILSQQTNSSTSIVDKAVQDLQTKKYEGKKKCVEWENDTNNIPSSNEETSSKKTEGASSKPSTTGSNTSRKCIRYETVTPGSLVQDSMKKVMGSDQERSRLARELSDVLASALGRLTNKLIQVGIDKIQEKVGKQSTMDNLGGMVNDAFGNIYQNEYDVLGVTDDARIFNNNGEQSSDNTTTENGNSTENGSDYKKPTGGDSSIPYVGGPEDLIGLNWNKGPELIVELKGNLEKSLDLTKKYLDLNTKISQKLKSTKDNIAILDYCRPGPDFGWEKRYRDKANFIMGLFKNSKDDKEACADYKFEMNQEFFDMGLPLVKEMNNDTNINIPGAGEMSSIINSILGSNNKELIQMTNGNRQEKRVLYNSLLRLKVNTENNEFKNARDNIDTKIKLFSDEIHKEKITTDTNGKEVITKTKILTDNDLKEILGIKVVLVKETGELIGITKGNNIIKAHINEKGSIIKETGSPRLNSFDNDTMSKEYLIEYRDLYSFKDNKQEDSVDTQEVKSIPETPETLVSGNREKAEQLVIDLAWDIWRINVNKDLKSRLRYQYYTIKNKLVTEQDLLKLEIQSNDARANSKKLAKEVLDCIAFLKITEQKNDSEIKTFLENEYEKQENGETSLFKTDLFTSPANIKTSILQFVDSDNTIDDYYKKNYPDIPTESFQSGISGSSSTSNHQIGKTVNQILELDETRRTVQDNMTESIFNNNDVNTAIFTQIITADPLVALIKYFTTDTKDFDPNQGKELFCNIKTLKDTDKCVKGTWDFGICASEKKTGIKPAQRWYFGKKLSYSAAFVGI